MRTMAGDKQVLGFVVIFTFICGLSRGNVIEAPDSFTIGDAFSVRCSLNLTTTTITEVSNIQIYRNSSAALGSDESRIVSVTYNRTTAGSTIKWQDESLRARATAEGNVQSIEAAHLELNITMTTCADSATYRCTVTATDTNFESTEKRIFGKVNPGAMNDITAVAFNGTLENGLVTNETKLELNCSGTVGSPPGDLRWCVKYGNGNYQPVMANYQSEPVAKEDNCQFERYSVLHYDVTNNDTMTTFLCEVEGTYTCGGAPNSLTYQISTESAVVVTTTSPSSATHLTALFYRRSHGSRKISGGGGGGGGRGGPHIGVGAGRGKGVTYGENILRNSSEFSYGQFVGVRNPTDQSLNEIPT